MIREDGVDVFVEMDVGSDYNSNSEQIRSVLYSVVKEGAIASYVTSVQGFQFRQLGEGKIPAKWGGVRCSSVKASVCCIFTADGGPTEGATVSLTFPSGF